MNTNDRAMTVRESVYRALHEEEISREETLFRARAGAGAKLAQVLGQDASADRISAVGGSMASGLFSSAVQQSLSSFGTARVKLNLSSAHLDGSEFDFLLPLYENRSHLFFSQTGIRRIDDRTMANLGMGYRFWPSDSAMFGANMFYDYDVSRQHKRLGTGLEYARDFFRVSANGYYRLSDWKRSRDLTDYHERVANGFDIRTEAWLPGLPQLGGKITWARYYGDQVGIFGPDDLQKNPQVLTLGLNYTPVPLAGISLQKTVNTRGGGDEFSIGLNLSWQFGLPLKTQLDPERVRFNRTLAGSRYDLVDRNNVIVLEYKKDRLFSVAPHHKVSGVESSQLALNLDISSRYAVAGIGWQGQDFFAAGGDITNVNGAYVIVLPEWQTTGSNHYLLEGRAIDEKGNLSAPFRVEVDVLPLDVKISLAGDLKGEEGQTLALGLNVRSTGTIGKVDWKAPEFLAAGGKFIQTRAPEADNLSLNYSVVLPPYKASGENSYPIEVTVSDSEGNVSNTASARIVVEPRSIVLTVPPEVEGNEGERIALPLTIDAKTAVTRLDWEAPEFVAHGGKVTVEKDKVWLDLPAWSDSGSNQYAITLTAGDDQNHRSAPVTATVSVASAAINLVLDENLTGNSGEELIVKPQASAQSNIDRIEWQGEAFFSAGGKITQDGTNAWRFTLPLWKKEGTNRYSVRAVAWDKSGRSSTPVTLTLEVQPVSIAVSAPDTLTGTEQETVDTTINVVSEGTTVSDVQFSAEDFLAAGGKITGTLPDYHFVMPAWQATGSNHYSITVTGKDPHGNISEPTKIEVVVSQAPFTITAETAVTGFEGSTTEVTPEVQSLYGVANYQIEASAFKSAGGTITEKEGTFMLTLPGFIVGGENRYPVTIRAVDRKGTVSSPLELNVVVTTQLLDANGQCSVVGGGEGYASRIDKDSVNYQEATDYATLKALVDAGTPYIYIPGDVEIELPVRQNALFIKSGTTIFSDRGANGSEGARLSIPYMSEEENKFPIIMMDSNTRISGIRYEGPYKGTLTKNTTIGIQTVEGSHNVEVDNMELWGWPWAAVSVKKSTNVRVHHSYIHQNIKKELGYGVVVQNGNATAEVACNLFNSNRHSIAGSGMAGEGYAAHHNLVLNGGELGAYHQFDMHRYQSAGAGAFMEVTQNWFDYGRYGTSNRSSIGVRGQPSRGPITVTDNWFSQPWKNGTQYAVAGEYGTWVPTVESILATNKFSVKFNYLNKGSNQCVIDWLSYSQSINCAAVN
ncbi:inverse autotransporter beta domain-containing protein [Enterobacter cloacae]|uniref:inverse autotransporter beta domain-containing protein n=1 Tax=Enterobacter cloacae TaxID=550 RepID=UPI00190B4ADF|nr:inverse autotransporter beta domain-containing protein [Enterobacter cloacae]MBK4272198.1 inverse autotransporter beta domain-containing protein [Enterobacter cloacae]MBK4436115.1 inverse autotransporter beta domain-containing protein [Enterobacter cloacae]MBK4531443.1 inverse autotransporter beta domain-containing protein [Enterobacter cloacae]MBK4604760.1 inverse autotransporter beta domain-containing protein [Enterobacter cloacae]